MPVLGRPMASAPTPEAGFYLWLPVPDGDDAAFTWRLNHEYNCLVAAGQLPRAWHATRAIPAADGSAWRWSKPGSLRRRCRSESPIVLVRSWRGRSAGRYVQTRQLEPSTASQPPRADAMTDRTRAVIESAWEERAGLDPKTAAGRGSAGGGVGDRRPRRWHTAGGPRGAPAPTSRRAGPFISGSRRPCCCRSGSPTTSRSRRRRLQYFDKVPTKFAGIEPTATSPRLATASSRLRSPVAGRSSGATSC